MLARFRASSPDRCPQAAKSPCHTFGTRRGWWEKRQLFEAGRTRPPRLVKPESETDILQLFRGNSCNEIFLQKTLYNSKKFFDPTIFQKCWRGVGEQPTFAKQIWLCSLFFLLQLHFLKLTNSQFDYFYKTSCKFGQGNGAIAARWQAKAGVEPPFAGCLRPFSLGEIALREITRIRFGKAGAHPQLAWESQLPLKPCISLQPLDFKGNCDSFDFLLNFYCCLLSTLCRGQLAPCTPRRAEPARPQLPAARFLQPIS